MRDVLSEGFARLQIVEKHPLVPVLAPNPPQLSPDFVLSPARTT
jgi:hypothetical protein